jgi:hypothetical protein
MHFRMVVQVLSDKDIAGQYQYISILCILDVDILEL